MSPRDTLQKVTGNLSAWQKTIAGLGASAAVVAVVWIMMPYVAGSARPASAGGSDAPSGVARIPYVEARLEAHIETTNETLKTIKEGQTKQAEFSREMLALLRQISNRAKLMCEGAAPKEKRELCGQ